MTPSEAVIKIAAVAYLAMATVDLAGYLFGEANANSPPEGIRLSETKFTFLVKKPLNCELCMSFWWAIPLFFVPEKYAIVPAVAYGAALLIAVKNRLETFL